ncbi:hypothetical protein [Aeromicrobium ginsengisoli]|nr:hypothetical protein [Aeromicrobium ginsengisoli]
MSPAMEYVSSASSARSTAMSDWAPSPVSHAANAASSEPQQV